VRAGSFERVTQSIVLGQIGLGAAVWLLAVLWLEFVWNREVDLGLVVVTGSLFVLSVAATHLQHDRQGPTWRQQETDFVDFLHSNVAIYTGMRRGQGC
jgi:hypothetical protein